MGKPDTEKTVVWKIAISVLFGAMGFVVNFYPVDFVFYGSYKMSFLFGLLFPMLITLAWGWRYGLLSALCGGCQTMWLLWGPQSSYATLASVPPFTLWIIWLGWFSRTRRNIYLGELLFRIFNSVILYIAFRGLFALNVPPANLNMPLSVAHSIVLKEAVNGLFILFLARALLQSELARKFFKLQRSQLDPRLRCVYANATIFGGIIVFLLVGERYLWHAWGREFRIAARILGSLLLFLFGLAGSYVSATVFVRRETEDLRRAEERLDHLNKVLSGIRNVNQLITKEKDRDKILKGACRHLVAARGYHKAWIAILDDNGDLLTTAEAGLDEDFAPIAGGLERGELTAYARKALAQPEIVIVKDSVSDCGNCPLAEKHAGRIIIATRVKYEEMLYGVLCISAPKDIIPDEKEHLLVQEVAGDIAFALYAADQREKRALAEQALRESEQELQRAQRMESLGTLAGGIAHDFNNLLMVIMARISLMSGDKDTSHADFEHLKAMETCVESAAGLTKQLLGFARGGKYEVKPINLSELVKQTSALFGRTRKEIRIYRNCRQDVLAVNADQAQLEQVLMNLYINAWQAMPGGGDLHLETQNVTVDENEAGRFRVNPGRYVKVSVRDTGVGMDKATQERVFEPFFSTKADGRGLGLASSYGIVRNHGGFATVYSEKNKGTVFTISLPASDAKAVTTKAPAEKVLPGEGTILLVDDEEMIISASQALLKHLGYEVLLARNGRKALEIYRANQDKIRLVIIDMIMPVMGGGELYDKLREINPTIKVLLSSGYSVNGQAQDILNRGCNGFIQKPFGLRALSRKLKQVINA